MDPSPRSESEHLTSSDRRALLLWLLLGVAGALFAFKYYFAAFPEAAVNFQVSRAEALERARHFVTGLGENLTGYQSSIVFDVDDNAKTYLERELGLAQANRVMASEINIWNWEVRFFRPLQEEEYRVWVSPAGRIAGYDHQVAEASPGATLARAAAGAKAQKFLVAQYQAPLKDWEFLPEEANSTLKPKRLHWSFTWERRGFRAKDAPYRLKVTVQGGAIGGAREFLKVPEAWERDYKHLRSTNIFYNQLALIPYILLLGAALWVGILLTRRGQTRWSGAIKLGGFVAAALFLMQLNQWPISRAAYDTHSSYSSFVAIQLVNALLFAVGSALTVALVLPAGDALYRVAQPTRLRLAKAFTLRGLRTREFFNSAVVGLCLAAAHIGFVVAFYLIGSWVGVWAPQELNYENSVSTTFPWISGVAIGLFASTNEEFLFRLFAVPFLERVTRSRWLAVILPAFSWSFLHSAYPQEPGYIRGIEVGIIGVVAGLVLLRWGIVATLIWHYTVDALLVGLLLIRSNSLYFKISGAAVGAAAVAPLLFAGAAYLLRGRFETDESLLNSAEPLPDVELAMPVAATTAPAAPARHYDALTRGAFGFLALCIVVGGILAWKLKPESVGDYLSFRVNAREARRIADQTLRSRGLRPENYRAAASLVPLMDRFTNEFLRRRIGIAGINRIYDKEVPGALWRVRYFRDGDPEEYAVVVRPDGSLHAVRHTLAEAAPGASLSKEEAILRAETFLREAKKIDLKQWHLVETISEKRPHRIDHTLRWERTRPLDDARAPTAPERLSPDHAYARIEVQVLGNEVTNFRTFIKIPDAWRRAQQERSLPRALYSIGRSLFFVGLSLTMLILFLKRLRSEAASTIPWRRLAKWSLWALGGFLLAFFCGSAIPDLLSAYSTEVPMKIFLGELGVGVLIFSALVFGGLALVLGLAWYYASCAFGMEHLPGWNGMPASYYRDAVWIGLGGMVALAGLDPLLTKLGELWPTLHRSLDASIGMDFDALLPFGGILGDALSRGLLYTGLVALIAAFIVSEIRPVWLRLSLFGASCLALIGGWGNAADFAKELLTATLGLAVIVFGVRRFVRFNLLGCFLIAMGSRLLEASGELFGQPDAFYCANGYALLIALALLFAWPLVMWRVQSGANAQQQA